MILVKLENKKMLTSMALNNRMLNELIDSVKGSGYTSEEIANISEVIKFTTTADIRKIMRSNGITRKEYNERYDMREGSIMINEDQVPEDIISFLANFINTTGASGVVYQEIIFPPTYDIELRGPALDKYNKSLIRIDKEIKRGEAELVKQQETLEKIKALKVEKAELTSNYKAKRKLTALSKRVSLMVSFNKKLEAIDNRISKLSGSLFSTSTLKTKRAKEKV